MTRLAAGPLFAITLGYLGLLFVVARLGDRRAAAARLSRHPLVAALSLGVYATSWSYFGAVGMAARDGWMFLSIYLGVVLACALIPAVWLPLGRLQRERQLATDALVESCGDQLVGALKEQVRQAIGAIAQPDRVLLVSGLPKTRSGKIMRRILRKVAAGETSELGDTTTLADPAVVDEIVRAAAPPERRASL